MDFIPAMLIKHSGGITARTAVGGNEEVCVCGGKGQEIFNPGENAQRSRGGNGGKFHDLKLSRKRGGCSCSWAERGVGGSGKNETMPQLSGGISWVATTPQPISFECTALREGCYSHGHKTKEMHFPAKSSPRTAHTQRDSGPTDGNIASNKMHVNSPTFRVFSRNFPHREDWVLQSPLLIGGGVQTRQGSTIVLSHIMWWLAQGTVRNNMRGTGSRRHPQTGAGCQNLCMDKGVPTSVSVR